MPSPQDYIENGRDFINRRGDRLNQDAESRANVARQGRAAYQGYADEVYDPLIGGRGGYSPEEQALIYGDMRGVASDEDLQGNFLSPEEFNASQGRPWDRAAYFDPESDMARQYESSGRVRGAVGQYGDEMGRAIGTDLGVDQGYSSDMQGMVTGTASRMRGAVDPSRLRADSAALDRIRMSPEEQQRMVTAAGMSAGVGYRAAADDVERRGRAAGMNPLGVAAARSRLENSAAVSRGDAMTLARVRAGESAASRAGQAENFRMRGEESASDRVGAAEQAAGNFEFGARSSMEDRRLGAARDQSNRRMDVANNVGQSRIRMEEGNRQAETASRNFNTGMGTDIATGIERDATARATAAANNRQQVNMANQGTRFNQNFATQQARADRAIQVGNARRQDAAEGRGYLQSRINAGIGEEQADYNRQAAIYGTQGGLLQGNTNSRIEQDRTPRWWERIGGLAVGAVGAASGFAGRR